MTGRTSTHCRYLTLPSGRSTPEADGEGLGAAPPRSPLDIFEAVKGFESDGYSEQYVKNFNLSRADAKAHLVEVLKYLSLVASGQTGLTPSEQLDEAWHALLIQTRDYQELCGLLGKFVHHTTKEAPQVRQYKRCLSAYREWFGEPHPIWEMANINRVKAGMSSNAAAGINVTGWCSDNDGDSGGDDDGGVG